MPFLLPWATINAARVYDCATSVLMKQDGFMIGRGKRSKRWKVKALDRDIFPDDRDLSSSVVC
jgi:hypothetical protein